MDVFFVREGRISDAHQIGRYAAHRRRAILVASIIDLELVASSIVDESPMTRSFALCQPVTYY